MTLTVFWKLGAKLPVRYFIQHFCQPCVNSKSSITRLERSFYFVAFVARQGKANPHFHQLHSLECSDIRYKYLLWIWSWRRHRGNGSIQLAKGVVTWIPLTPCSGVRGLNPTAHKVPGSTVYTYSIAIQF